MTVTKVSHQGTDILKAHGRHHPSVEGLVNHSVFWVNSK